MPTGSASGRGRPRDPAIDAAVLDATLAVLAAEGIDGISMDRVAASAGVAKMTIYNRYPGKWALIGAALRHLQVGHVPHQTGDTRADLIALLKAMTEQYAEVDAHSINGSCLAMEPRSTELLDTIRQSTILPRRSTFAAVLTAGVERGDVRADVDIDMVVSLLTGVIHADHLAGIDPPSNWAASLVDTVLRGVLAG